MDLSVVIPVYNEQDSIKLLVKQLIDLQEQLPEKIMQIIFVDDGSNDDTNKIINREISDYSNMKIICLSKNFGQTAALSAGIDNADGDVLITMDADLQNDPSDIPKLLNKLEDGYDVVSGWRDKRNDKYFSRILPSKIANWIISKISGVHLHDYGCTLKAYRKELLGSVRLYGEMHRFIPIYIAWEGGKITEIPVKHHHR